MLVRCSSLLLVLLASRASAQGVPQYIPGTGEDPIVSLGVLPQFVDAPLLQGIAVRGGNPEDTKVMFDGFELPQVFHGRLRSVVSRDAISSLTLDTDVIDRGRGTNFIELTSAATVPTSAMATLIDVEAMTTVAKQSIIARVAPIATDNTPRYVDLVTRMGGVSAFIYEHGLRGVFHKSFRRGIWRTQVAISTAASSKNLTTGDTRSIDGRAETTRTAPTAGLAKLVWRTGIETTNTRHDVGRIVWTPDLGAWTAASALLSQNIVVNAGLRFDAFFRGGDLATQPRGSIKLRLPGNTTAKLEAGAYRRPAEQRDELAVDHLHPERSTQVVATVAHTHGPFDVQLAGYYIDRTHLIVRDQLGTLANTGFGTSQGLELISMMEEGHWHAFLSASLSKSTRHDHDRAAERPADFDQPVRIDGLVGYREKTWAVSARMSVSSGLPYTPVVESIYQSDTDTYEPLYGFHNTGRLPFMHQLSIRADYRFNRHFSAFLDLHNAYAASTALGYEYSYDYKRRLDVTLPILPFVGIRGDL